jgi:ketosteroid isomerase-like protein
MSVNAPSEIMDRFYADFGTGNLDAALSACAEDLEIVDPGMGHVHGRERFREYLETFKRAMPDAPATIEQTVDSGELVVVEGRFTGTHSGPLATEDDDVGPTGASVDLDSLISRALATGRSSPTTRTTTSSGC